MSESNLVLQINKFSENSRLITWVMNPFTVASSDSAATTGTACKWCLERRSKTCNSESSGRTGRKGPHRKDRDRAPTCAHMLTPMSAMNWWICSAICMPTPFLKQVIHYSNCCLLSPASNVAWVFWQLVTEFKMTQVNRTSNNFSFNTVVVRFQS